MYIAYWSDLHIETQQAVEKFRLSLEQLGKQDCILILAGDICSLNLMDQVVTICNEFFETTLFVAGNHEFWGYDFDTALSIMKSHESVTFKVLYNDIIELHGVKFAGTTLFTNLSGVEHLASDFSDFKFIKNMTLEKWHEENKKAIEFISNSNADIVITHHAPFLESCTPMFFGDKNNKFYLNDLDEISKNWNTIKYWFNGHVHHEYRYIKNGYEVLCNPKGYYGEENNNIDLMFYKFS